MESLFPKSIPTIQQLFDSQEILPLSSEYYGSEVDIVSQLKADPDLRRRAGVHLAAKAAAELYVREVRKQTTNVQDAREMCGRQEGRLAQICKLFPNLKNDPGKSLALWYTSLALGK